MPSADLLIPFFLASAVFACLPGSSMLYAVARTLASGRKVGWASALGFHVAGLGHTAAAALGVSALLVLLPTLFTVMKFAGAAYLIWLGLRYLKGAPPRSPASCKPPVATARRALRDSVIVEAMNPKSALFFFAFLPQFTDPAATFPIWLQIVVLGIIVNGMFSLTDAILIEMSHALASRLRASARLLRVLQKLGGGLLIALGINLALARNP
ncbi:LysE family translocator [Pelagibius marinus]|uniref:LysE family translocator n=1 Tax=Pelagibius marinus TaxID=2762760 RepID=UPI00187317AD|nr:LysE family translocator [Pelagibius marinus]